MPTSSDWSDICSAHFGVLMTFFHYGPSLHSFVAKVLSVLEYIFIGKLDQSVASSVYHTSSF